MRQGEEAGIKKIRGPSRGKPRQQVEEELEGAPAGPPSSRPMRGASFDQPLNSAAGVLKRSRMIKENRAFSPSREERIREGSKSGTRAPMRSGASSFFSGGI
jgi:hypothetical protein